MAHYLVRARAKPEKLGELGERLATDAFVDLEPFGRALTKGLRGARIEGGGVLWEEEDYCAPPLAEERAAGGQGRRLAPDRSAAASVRGPAADVSKGAHPWHLAAAVGAGRHVIERLLAHGARVGARDRAGRTRLEARVEGHEKVIEMLRGYRGEAKP